MTSVKLLLFDVFGTLVDWHGSIAREVDALGLMHRATTAGDGATFAKAWRAQYQPAMEAVRAGRIPFSKLDVLHRHNLDRVLADFGLPCPMNGTSAGATRAPAAQGGATASSPSSAACPSWASRWAWRR
jgi:hypothetical protein